MQDRKVVAIENAAGIWDGLLPDFSQGTIVNDYHITLQMADRAIDVDVSSSPGGNIEGGYETTSIKAAVPGKTDFQFAFYPEDFLNKIGKLFGLQDVIIGYPEFDHRLIVKTNNPDQLKQLLAPEENRTIFQQLSGFSLTLSTTTDNDQTFLDLHIQRAITDLNELKQLLTVFSNILLSLGNQ